MSDSQAPKAPAQNLESRPAAGQAGLSTPVELAISDLEIIDHQESLLRFSVFDADAAWSLGTELRARLLSSDAGATLEIELGGQLLFACATPGAKPNQADWIRRKRNTVRHFHRSTYAIGRMLERDGSTMEKSYGLPLADYAAHGGGFPLWVAAEVVGSVVLSGLPQREDHRLVVAALASVLGIEVPSLS